MLVCWSLILKVNKFNETIFNKMKFQYLLSITFLPIGSKSCNTNGRSTWNKRGIILKNKPHLVTFHKNILVSLWTFRQHSYMKSFYVFYTTTITNEKNVYAREMNNFLGPIFCFKNKGFYYIRHVFEHSEAYLTSLHSL